MVLLCGLILAGPVQVAVAVVAHGWLAAVVSALLTEAVVAWASWQFTIPRRGDVRRTDWLRKALRALALTSAGLNAAIAIAGAPATRAVPSGASALVTVVGLLLNLVGLLYVSERLLRLDRRGAARGALILAVVTGLLSIPTLLVLLSPFSGWPASGLLWLGIVQVLLALFALRYILGLRSALRVISHEWWLDPRTLPDEAWVSYVELADRRVEILFANGDSDQFMTVAQAREWLDTQGFVPAATALSKGVAHRLPDGPSAAPRAGRWLQ